MENKLNNVLFINSGGGIGDALTCLPTLNYLNNIFDIKNLYYYGVDHENFWFEKSLAEFKPSNLITVKNFPKVFGFRLHHFRLSKNLISLFDFDHFDLIIDNQTVLKRTLIYKRIPHKNYMSPCLNYMISKPFLYMKKREEFVRRIIDYFNKIKKINNKPSYSIKIPENFLNEAKKLIPDKNYIGFSITAGHPLRIKEINFDEIIKVANHFSDKFIPSFFIENKYQDLIKKIKDNVKNAYFPEHEASNEYKKPMLVTALGALTKFNITIDNGISHMLSFSNNKNYIFYNHSSQKFLPLNGQSFAFDCKLNNTSIDQLSAEKIIEFIQNN